MCPCIPDRIGIWQCKFFWRRESRSEHLEKNLSEQGELNLLYMIPRTRATLLGGECPHHFATPAPRETDKIVKLCHFGLQIRRSD